MYIIVTNIGTGYPFGIAPTSRGSLYARGLLETGGRVLVLCPGPSEYTNKIIMNRDAIGIKDGVAFEYTCGTTIRGKSFLQQKWLVLKGLFRAAWRIWLLHKTNSVDVVLIFSDRWVTILFFWFVAKLCRTKYVSEQNEQPFYQAEHYYFWKVVSLFYTYTLFRLFDGAIVISNYLWDYMRKRMRHSATLLKLPILVDVNQFSSDQSASPILGKYLAYCGTWIEAQDGIQSLMKAFAKISNDFPNLKLVLIGDVLKVSVIPTYRSYAEELGISERVIFTGFVSRRDLISYLTHASILCLAKPFNLQSEAAFPTKLGEYLATGKPVLVTKTGQIATFLEDNLNVFLAPPDDVAAFAERLHYILLHPEEAAVVGRRGREAALRYFDYKENGKKIKAFIDQLWQAN